MRTRIANKIGIFLPLQSRLAWQAGLTGLLCYTLSAALADGPVATTTVYVQASAGSFNHQAIDQMYSRRGGQAINYHFSGSPRTTFARASDAGKPAFVAVHNSLIAGNMVQASVEAMRYYRATAVTAGIYLPIRMCLLRHREGLAQSLPLQQIASHPAALQQITRWKDGRNLTEIPLAKGTAFAAESVANGSLPLTTGAIGSCQLQQRFPALIVVEKNIQDSDNNRTLFAQLEVSRRAQPLDEAQARIALGKVIARAQQWAN